MGCRHGWHGCGPWYGPPDWYGPPEWAEGPEGWRRRGYRRQMEEETTEDLEARLLDLRDKVRLVEQELAALRAQASSAAREP